MNANALAKLITQREGKKVSISIAQVKEVLRILAECFAVDEDRQHAQAFVAYCEAMEKKAEKRAKAKRKARINAIETSITKRLKNR